MSDMLPMSDEEQTAENGRCSCVSAKGFVALCNFLVWVFILHWVALLLLWFCNKSCIGYSFSCFPSMWNSIACTNVWYFWSCGLPQLWCKDFFYCVCLGQPMKCNLHMNGNVITSDQPILL